MGNFIAKFRDNNSATFNANFSDSSSASFIANFGASQFIITGDYNDLGNKPQINGITLEGNKTSEELNIISDKHFMYEQLTPTARWEIEHPLDKYPSVTIVDSAGSVVVGDIEYIDASKVILNFQAAFTGKAFLN